MKYFFNWIISIRSLSKYSHIEIWTPDPILGFSAEYNDYPNPYYMTETHYLGKCWTATMRGKDNGTVVRGASEVLKHPENWDYIEIEVEDWQYNLLIEIMQYSVDNNLGYSTWDILKFVSVIHIPDNKRDICSEFTNNKLVHIEFLKGYGIVLPSTVAKKLTKKGLKIHSLIKE
jgi:hypothetical protein